MDLTEGDYILYKINGIYNSTCICKVLSSESAHKGIPVKDLYAEDGGVVYTGTWFAEYVLCHDMYKILSTDREYIFSKYADKLI